MEKKNEYGKLTIEELKEAVEHCFREKPIEEAKKGVGDFIDVYESEGQLSFAVKSTAGDKDDRRMTIRTGIGGFINIYNICPWAMQMSPVRLNGQVLEGELVDEFWEQFAKIKKKYENGKDS